MTGQTNPGGSNSAISGDPLGIDGPIPEGELVAVFSVHDIDEAMVTRAAIAFYRTNVHDPELSLHDQAQKAMRAALEAALRGGVG